MKESGFLGLLIRWSALHQFLLWFHDYPKYLVLDWFHGVEKLRQSNLFFLCWYELLLHDQNIILLQMKILNYSMRLYACDHIIKLEILEMNVYSEVFKFANDVWLSGNLLLLCFMFSRGQKSWICYVVIKGWKFPATVDCLRQILEQFSWITILFLIFPL